MVFAITRQYASGGHEVGRRLAEVLDIPFYDNRTIALAAAENGISAELFGEAEEKADSGLIYSLMVGDYTFGSHGARNGEMPISDKLFIAQSAVMEQAARQGPCVIVGQCADYVLREHRNLFSVFIHADKLERMDRVVQEYGIAPEKAAESLVKKDRQRSGYYTFYTGRQWDDFENYDLAIDSSAVGIDQAVDLICSTAENKEERRRSVRVAGCTRLSPTD